MHSTRGKNREGLNFLRGKNWERVRANLVRRNIVWHVHMCTAHRTAHEKKNLERIQIFHVQHTVLSSGLRQVRGSLLCCINASMHYLLPNKCCRSHVLGLQIRGPPGPQRPSGGQHYSLCAGSLCNVESHFRTSVPPLSSRHVPEAP